MKLQRDRSRREFTFWFDRPFYFCLRLGLTQCALWIGRGLSYRYYQVFNVFPEPDWPGDLMPKQMVCAVCSQSLRWITTYRHADDPDIIVDADPMPVWPAQTQTWIIRSPNHVAIPKLPPKRMADLRASVPGTSTAAGGRY